MECGCCGSGCKAVLTPEIKEVISQSSFIPITTLIFNVENTAALL